MPLLTRTQGDVMPLYGVDVASYQGRPDWKKVYGSGIRFAFSKVTQGTSYLNPTWPHNRKAMAALGPSFLPGAYHFLTAGTDPAAQARYFLQHAGDVSGLAVALDVEPTDGSRPTAAQARAWVAEFKRLTRGHPVIGYFPGWYHAELGRPDLSCFDTLWQSHYVDGAGSPSSLYARVPGSWWAAYGREQVSILQYSSSATVPGIVGRCDINAYRGTLAELRVLAPGKHSPPAPAPDEEDTLKIQLNAETAKRITIQPGKRASLALEKEKYDVGGWHNIPQAAWFPKDHAYYQTTAEVSLEGTGGHVRLAIGKYKNDANDLLSDALADDKTAASGKSTLTLSGLVWMGPDHKYRLDVHNNGTAPITVTGAAMRVAR